MAAHPQSHREIQLVLRVEVALAAVIDVCQRGAGACLWPSPTGTQGLPLKPRPCTASPMAIQIRLQPRPKPNRRRTWAMLLEGDLIAHQTSLLRRSTGRVELQPCSQHWLRRCVHSPVQHPAQASVRCLVKAQTQRAGATSHHEQPKASKTRPCCRGTTALLLGRPMRCRATFICHKPDSVQLSLVSLLVCAV